jgi:hypothetical protein
MTEYRRVSWYNPETKRNHFKTLSAKKYTEEQFKKISEEWLSEMKQKHSDKDRVIGEIPNLPYAQVIEQVTPALDYPDGTSTVIIGATKSGKTYLLTDLDKKIYRKKENKFINIIFSQSIDNIKYKKFREYPHADQFYSDICKYCYIINKNTDPHGHYRFNIILDDVLGAKHEEQINKLLMIYRNSNISCTIVGQARTVLNPEGRGNINYLFFFNLITDSQVEATIKEYLSSYFPKDLKMDDKIRLYRELTQDHYFLFLNALEGKIYRSKVC